MAIYLFLFNPVWIGLWSAFRVSEVSINRVWRHHNFTIFVRLIANNICDNIHLLAQWLSRDSVTSIFLSAFLLWVFVVLKYVTWKITCKCHRLLDLLFSYFRNNRMKVFAIQGGLLLLSVLCCVSEHAIKRDWFSEMAACLQNTTPCCDQKCICTETCVKYGSICRCKSKDSVVARMVPVWSWEHWLPSGHFSSGIKGQRTVYSNKIVTAVQICSLPS